MSNKLDEAIPKGVATGFFVVAAILLLALLGARCSCSINISSTPTNADSARVGDQ